MLIQAPGTTSSFFIFKSTLCGVRRKTAELARALCRGLLKPQRPCNKPNFPYWRNRQFLLIIIFLNIASVAFAETLTASWYSRASLIKEGTWKDGKEKRMANNERFDEKKFTASSWDFSLNAKVKVINLERPNKSVVVKITDRPALRFKGKRIDLSLAAMSALGGKQALDAGLVKVQVERISGKEVQRKICY